MIESIQKLLLVEGMTAIWIDFVKNFRFIIFVQLLKDICLRLLWKEIICASEYINRNVVQIGRVIIFTIIVLIVDEINFRLDFGISVSIFISCPSTIHVEAIHQGSTFDSV